ncbi:MAG: hypothetical protein JSS56_22535 [Proteobacteria bacterium]|nr:hypothetical protein [Pseudomonadota bacterium]
MTTYVLDTCVFNRALEGKFDRSDLAGEAEFVVCHIQIEELNNTKDMDKEQRMRLLLKLTELRPTLVPTESMVWDRGTSRR